jgi:flagellar biosynthesis protein FlhB
MGGEGFYEPTERHLRRLREEGRGPHGAVARGAAALAAGLGMAWLLRGYALDGARRGLAMAAVSPGATATALAPVGREAARWALAAAAVALAMALAAWVADAVVAGVATRRRSLAVRAVPRPGGARTWAVALGLEVVGLALAVLWLGGAFRSAGGDLERAASAMAGAAESAGAVIALLMAVADAVASRAAFLAAGRMTRGEFLEDQREARAPEAVTRRRAGRMRGRRR